MNVLIRNNAMLIPNYGERWRNGETITTAAQEEVPLMRLNSPGFFHSRSDGGHYFLSIVPLISIA
jgi:hypothetical protein